MGILVFVSFLLFWVHQSVRSTQISYRIQKLDSEIKRERSRETEFLMKIDQWVSLESVESIAKEKLGLIVPREKDIILISVRDP